MKNRVSQMNDFMLLTLRDLESKKFLKENCTFSMNIKKIQNTCISETVKDREISLVLTIANSAISCNFE